jgi:hypothetical protein
MLALGSPEYAAMLQREEEEEARRRLQMATALVDGAERWRESLRGLRHAPLHHVVGALACFAMLAYYVGEHLSLGLAILWAGVQFTIGCRPSCCRTTGAIVMLLFSASALVAPGAGVLATPFFELTLCHNTSGGAVTLYGMRSASVGSLESIPTVIPTATCVSTTSEPPVITVALKAPDLDADRDYRPVFLVPSDAHASLTLAVHDATGQEIYMPTRLELGAADEFPWARVKAAAATAAAAAAAAATTTAATTAATATAAATTAIAATAATFDASTRRLRHRRRLRGFRMGGGGFGGGSFSRGTGSFFSPRRGVSQGPSVGGRGPVPAFGRPVHGAPVAVGRPGAQYYTGTPFVGGGFRPTVGYHPALGYDIATGVMLAHVLRQPLHRRPVAVLHAPHAHDGAASEGSPLLAAPASRDGSFYYAAAALHAGSLLRVVPLTTAPTVSAPPTIKSAELSAHRPVLHALNSSYDRFAVVEGLRVPAAPAWPLLLTLSHGRAHVPSRAPHGAAASDLLSSGSTASGPTASGSWPPPLYFGLQAASPAHLRSTRLAQRASDALGLAAASLLMLLASLALMGAVSNAKRSGAWEGAWERADSFDGGSDSEAETAGEAGRAPGGGPYVGADGEILAIGSRVQTQHTRARGGDDSWYAGAVLELHANRQATIIYDDGVEEVAPLDEVYTLQGANDDEEDARPLGAARAQLVAQPVAVVVGVPVAPSEAQSEAWRQR